VASVVLELVVHVEQDILPHPITLHFRIPSREVVSGRFLAAAVVASSHELRASGKPAARGSSLPLIASPPARRATFVSRETTYSSPSLPSYSASRPPCAISARDSASTRKPSTRGALVPTRPLRFSAPVHAASNRVPGWRPSAHPGTAPTGCILRPTRPPQPDHLPCAHSVFADDRGKDW